MKLIERIQPIAQLDDYAEFVEKWSSFEQTGRIIPGHAFRMIQLARLLNQYVLRAAAEHAKAQADRSGPSLTDFCADQLIIEARIGAEHALKRALPALAAFNEFAENKLRLRRLECAPRPPAMEA
jgi:hypothetical protein